MPGTRAAEEDGFTLVELLVAMVVAMVLIAVSMSVLIASSDSVKTTRQATDLNEEARHAINRMARDLRQADSVVTAVNPDGGGFDATRAVAIRFRGDFDGDGCFGGGSSPCLPYSASNPEDVTYCYDPSTSQLYVIDNQAAGVTPVTPASTSCLGGQPLLAGNVAGFKVSYRSSAYLYDVNPSDGVTSWMELDQAGSPVGNLNGGLDIELDHVNAAVLELNMRVDGRTQSYRTQVDLRNRAD